MTVVGISQLHCEMDKIDKNGARFGPNLKFFVGKTRLLVELAEAKVVFQWPNGSKLLWT